MPCSNPASISAPGNPTTTMPTAAGQTATYANGYRKMASAEPSARVTYPSCPLTGSSGPSEWNFVDAAWKTPFQPFLPTSAYALAASRHMHQYGTTRAHLAEVAVAARQWSDRLGRVVPLAGLFGALAGVAGTLARHLLSYQFPKAGSVPTGPTIVLCATALVGLSLVFGTARGWLWALRRRTAAVPGSEPGVETPGYSR